MIRALLTLVLAVLSISAYAGVNLQSVTSTDAGAGLNRIAIKLSEETPHTLQTDFSGNILRIRLQNVDDLGGSPSFPRLSKIIDRVDVYREGTTAVIEIKTMKPIQYEYSMQNKQLLINLGTGANIPIPGSSRVKRYRARAGIQTPLPIPETEIEPSAPSDSAASDSLITKPITVAEKYPKPNPLLAFLLTHRDPLLLILIGLILLLVIIRFIRYFSKRSLNRPEKEPAGGSLL
ncbi:MAG: hypothetical protein Q8M98_05170, partial [Candidatus Cloacimonadaceae bacterium]|nr:hypothetical protein [Candidatus Cloacimonadaceae bacterium]